MDPPRLPCLVRVLVTGASGLVGTHLLPRLVEEGHHVIALSRRPEAHDWPQGVEARQWDGKGALPAVGADAVVNLAGASVVGARWSRAYMEQLRASRIDVTRRVVAWANAQQPPAILVQASAAGYYGNKPAACHEDRAPGQGFLAQLAADWERAAHQARGRLVVFRLAHVLARDGGYLGTLLPFVRWHMAGPIGGGRQRLPWVHVNDAVKAILWVLRNGNARGTFNLVAPGAAQATQREFARSLAQAAGKRGQLAVPLLAIRMRYGAGAVHALAQGADLRCDRLQAAGFKFRHAKLDEALADLLRRP